MQGFRSLAEGEALEFTIQADPDGRKKAIDVSGPGGAPVKVTVSILLVLNNYHNLVLLILSNLVMSSSPSLCVLPIKMHCGTKMNCGTR